jgi:hypothetical protein
MSSLKQKIRNRRNSREFNRALQDASPAMRSELIAIASRQNFNR